MLIFEIAPVKFHGQFGQAAADSDNRRLWRMSRNRLNAECIHDAILAKAGRLDLTMGRPSDRQFALSPGSHVTPIVNSRDFDVDGAAARRRSVYRFLFRTLPDPFQDALDCPSGDQITPVRANSVTVQQALALWNNAFVLRQAEHLADRVSSEASAVPQQIDLAVELAYGRAATEDERASLGAYAETHGMTNLCRCCSTPTSSFSSTSAHQIVIEADMRTRREFLQTLGGGFGAVAERIVCLLYDVPPSIESATGENRFVATPLKEDEGCHDAKQYAYGFRN